MSELPDQAAEPPKSAVFGAKVLIVVATAAAAGTVAYLWSSPNADRMNVASAAGELPAPFEQPQLPGTRVVPAPTAQPSPAPVSALRSFFSQSDEANSRERARQLTIKAARLWQVDAAARLIASPVDGNWDIDVVISGLASGSAVSVGTPAGPKGWRLPVSDLNRAAITPPRGFVGTMDLIMELRLANDTVVDRKGVLLEWSHNSMLAIAPFPPRQLEAAEIKVMVRTGLEYMANGKVGAARLMFQSAAEAGEAAAAFALAETYDPVVLEKLGAKGGITPDVALAQRWYEKAKELGSSAAPERIARLTGRRQ
jgi:TPR repeat protein